MVTLTPEERRILQIFKQRVTAAFPRDVVRISLFGSKARGDATEESDIDVIVVTRNDDWRTGDAIRRVGYDLDAEIGYKLSIQVLPASHMRYLAENGFRFHQTLTREAVAL